MILVSLACQMGNQMFQYAFAKATAKRLHTFFLPYQSNYWYPFKLGYFKLDWFTRLIFSSEKINKQYKRICRKLIQYKTKKRIAPDDLTVLSSFENNAYYDAFFQSETYFLFMEEKIKKCFRIKRKYRDDFEKKYGDFYRNNKVLVMHLRKTDYTEVEFEGLGGQGIALPVLYYKKTLGLIENINEYKIIVLSDDMEAAKKEFDNNPDYLFEHNSAIIDFQLIQHADIAIIANSSFSWWASYLSEKKDAVIYAPKYWLGFKVSKEYPAGIHTPRFNWITF
ncbi:MAG: alpha-1,2-fucosyltransferase [Prevotellaceae bacterium]|jgi:hypothetical protein|nr:alpha-1,2-fucosyltransferase [Prevotellaceae bacterium]